MVCLFNNKIKKIIFSAFIFGAFFAFGLAKNSQAIEVVNIDPDGNDNPVILSFDLKYYSQEENSLILKAEIDTRNILTQLKLTIYNKNDNTPFIVLNKNLSPSLMPTYVEFSTQNLEKNTGYKAVLFAQNTKNYQALKEIFFSTSRDFLASLNQSSQNNQTNSYTNSQTYSSTTIQSERPEVFTEKFQKTSASQAKLIGTVNPKNASTLAWFEWGESLNLENKTETKILSGSGYQKVYINIGGLVPYSRYYYRLVAKNKNGLSFGETKSFVFPKTINYSYKKPSSKKSQAPSKKTSTPEIAKTIPPTTATNTASSSLSTSSQTASLADSMRSLFNNKAFWIIFSLLFIFIVYLIFKK